MTKIDDLPTWYLTLGFQKGADDFGWPPGAFAFRSQACWSFPLAIP